MINLLPIKEKKELRKEYTLRVLIVFLFMGAVLFLIASLFLSPSYKYSVSKEFITQNNLEIFNAQNPQIDIENLNSEILKTNEKLSFIISKKNDVFVSDDVLERVLSLRTPGVSFSHISYSKNKDGAIVNIIGLASDRTALRSFKDSLSADQTFKSVDLPISNFIKPTNIDFNISIVLK